MEIISEAAMAAMRMPRFEDGCINLQELIRQLAESVVNEIMDVINQFRASMRSFNVTDNSRSGTYDILLKVAVPSNLELDKVISQIRSLRNVIKVSRS